MAFVVQHRPSAEAVGNLAYQSGAGQFQQARDQLLLELQQNQRRLDEQARQFDNQLAYRSDATGRQNALQSRQIQQRGDLAEMAIRERAQARAQDQASYLEREALRQGAMDRRQAEQFRSYRDMRQEQAAAAAQADVRRQTRERQNMLMAQGFDAWENINKFDGWSSPDQKEQAIQQWRQMYGEAFNGMTPPELPDSFIQADDKSAIVESMMPALMDSVTGQPYLPPEAIYGFIDTDSEGNSVLDRDALTKFITETVIKPRQNQLEREAELEQARIEAEKESAAESKAAAQEVRTNYSKIQDSLNKFDEALFKYKNQKVGEDGEKTVPKPDPRLYFPVVNSQEDIDNLVDPGSPFVTPDGQIGFIHPQTGVVTKWGVPDPDKPIYEYAVQKASDPAPRAVHQPLPNDLPVHMMPVRHGNAYID